MDLVIKWLKHFIDWGNHFVSTLTKIYDLISKAYDKYTEEDFSSNSEIEVYLDKVAKRANLAQKWYETSSTLYDNFDQILSGKYDWDAVNRLTKADSDLFFEINDICAQYDDNSDHYWEEKNSRVAILN